MRKYYLIITVLFGLMGLNSIAQEKYAVLICGEEVHVSHGDECLDCYPVGNRAYYNWTEFWDDTYLMWEMLVKPEAEGGMGFADENVYVLYADGTDGNIANSTWYADRYSSFFNFFIQHITDDSAVKVNVNEVFEGLSTGQNGFPQLTPDDFLFVWTFGHGNAEFKNGTGAGSLVLYDNSEVTEVELGNMLSAINTQKKAIWMQNCFSGLFLDNMPTSNSVYNTSSIGAANVADDYPVIENEVIDDSVYHHAEFDYHLYSSTNQETPEEFSYYNGVPLSNADLNNDNVISLYESNQWLFNHNTTADSMSFMDSSGISAYTSLRFPTLLFEDITISENHRGIIGVTKDVRVMPGQTLTLYDKAKVHFINDAKITVEAGASIVIGDNVEFIMDDPHGTSDPSHSALLVRGNISFGSNVKFSSKIGHNWKGLDFDAMTTSYSLQGIEFDHCGIYGSARLTVSNCTFEDAHVSLRSSTSSFSQCNFTNSSIYANVATSLHTLEVNNCSFDGTNEDYVIYLSDYQDFDISGNSISYSSGDGISLYYCGHGGISMEDISNNDIICSATSGTHYGVIAYQTDVDITNNTINGNSIGVASLNSSSSLLTGHTSVASLAQRITGNSQYQVYATSTSFPHTFEHNIIYGSSSPYVYAAGFYTPASLDVRNNYWGSNFNPSSHLYPSAAYDWFPVWTPNSYMLKESGPQDMLWQAMELVENGNYAQAENILKGIIDGYPEGEEAISATKVLYKMQAKHNSDYTGLKQYFQSTLELTEDTARMFRLLRSMVCWCDVKSGSLHQALSGFNQIIADPFDYPDQIFAELDKQYVEELVAAQANLKSDEAGRNTLAARQFELTRDLFGEEKGMDEWLSEESPLADLIIYQKTSGTATLQFDSEVSGEIEISLYSIDGRLCQQWHKSIQKGANHIELGLNSASPGVHLISLHSLGGQLFDSIKLSL